MQLKELSFEIIQKCPNNCIYCSSLSTKESKNIISYPVFKEVIDDAVELGLKRLCISGGEPFLHPNLIDMVGYAKKQNLDVYIYTSGIVIDSNEKYSSIPKDFLIRLNRLGIDKLMFNMQAAEENLYNKIMGTNGLFNLLKKSIQLASECGIFVEAHFVPMKINYEQIENVISLANTLNVKRVSFLRLVLQGRAFCYSNVLEMSNYDLEELRKTLSRIKENTFMDIRIGIPLNDELEKNKCTAGWGKLIIRYDGAVFPCEAFKYIDNINCSTLLHPDNINNTRLSNIWENSMFLNCLRNEIKSFQAISNHCEACPAQWRIRNLEGLRDKENSKYYAIM